MLAVRHNLGINILKHKTMKTSELQQNKESLKEKLMIRLRKLDNEGVLLAILKASHGDEKTAMHLLDWAASERTSKNG